MAGGQHGVEQEILPGDHGVLPLSESRQTLGQKCLGSRFGLRRADRPVEPGQCAEVVGKFPLDQAQHCLGGAIGRELRQSGRGQPPGGGPERFSASKFQRPPSGLSPVISRPVLRRISR